MSDAQRIAELEAQLAAAKSYTVKFGKKRNVCFYITGRSFPVSLYANEWLTLLDGADSIRTFIQDNSDELDWK